MALQRKRDRSKTPRRRPSAQTKFSRQHYRELGSEKTLLRERDFDVRGFPATGPSLGEEDMETPSIPEPLPSERPQEG